MSSTTATTAEPDPAGQRRLRILLSFGMVLLILLLPSMLEYDKEFCWLSG